LATELIDRLPFLAVSNILKMAFMK
jgi:hypothetical protein